MAKKSPKLPVIIAMKVSVDEAFEILRAKDPSISKSAVKRMRRDGFVLISVLTDTDTLKGSTANNAITRGINGGTVSAGGAAAETIGAAGSTAVLSKEQFLKLYAKQASLGNTGAKSLRNLLLQGGADIRAMTLSLDGRLAIGSMIVQGIGLVKGIGTLENAKTRKEVRDAWYSIYDSIAGLMGGLLEVMAVAVNSRVIAQAAAHSLPLRGDLLYTDQFAKIGPSLPLAALRVAGSLAGAAGGVINAAAAFAKAEDADKAGESSVAKAYLLSSVAFGGTAVTSTMVGVGVAADWIVARQISSAAIQRVATAVAVRIAALPVSPWSLVLLGAGVLLQVGAMVLTPTEIEKWIGRSYFGRGDNKFPKGDWKAEQDGLLEAIQGGTEAARKEGAKPVKSEALVQ